MTDSNTRKRSRRPAVSFDLAEATLLAAEQIQLRAVFRPFAAGGAALPAMRAGLANLLIETGRSVEAAALSDEIALDGSAKCRSAAS